MENELEDFEKKLCDRNMRITCGERFLDLRSIEHYLNNTLDFEYLKEWNDNEVEGTLREIQLTYSRLYIAVLELIAKGVINKRDIEHGGLKLNEDLLFIPNQLHFLNTLANAFKGVTILPEKIKEFPEIN